MNNAEAESETEPSRPSLGPNDAAIFTGRYLQAVQDTLMQP